MKPRLKKLVVATALATLALPARALDLDALKPRKLNGLWEFILPEVQGSGGGPLDFAPKIPGLEVVAVGTNSRCVVTSAPPPDPTAPPPPPVFRFEFKDRRQFLTTDGVPLPGIFETPVISTTPGPNSCAVTVRVGSNTAKARGTRVYMNSRAFVAPAGMVPDHSVWHIIVFDLGGAPRWSREFRPGGGPGANPDDVGWIINPGLSGVGDVLGFGDEDDVIRIYRQRFNPTSVDNRYTFLDVLTGEVIKDIKQTVERPVFAS